jgi:hypothetical protein
VRVGGTTPLMARSAPPTLTGVPPAGALTGGHLSLLPPPFLPPDAAAGLYGLIVALLLSTKQATDVC